MPTYLAPGVYVREMPGGPQPIEAVGTSTAGFVGVAPRSDARMNVALPVNNWMQFVRDFVGEAPQSTPLSNAVYGFFQNGGQRCYVVAVPPNQGVAGGGRSRQGIDALEQVDDIHIVAIPGYTDAGSYEAAIQHCEKMTNRVAILDPPLNVSNIDLLTKVATAPLPPAPPRARLRAPASAENTEGQSGSASGSSSGSASASGSGSASASGDAGGDGDGGLRPRESTPGFATFYFPWITVRDPLSGELVDVPPSGHMAGVWARVDATRGVHKAPANETVEGALNVTYRVTQEEQAELNPASVNCIRFFPREGIRVYGARTLAADASEWRYLNVRRLFCMIEESIALGTNWVVFEPNSQSLWKAIRRDVSAFMTRVWRDGALMGRTPEEAFFVKCDEETNPPEVIDAGQLVTVIGAAPVKPAEFIIFEISQSAQGAQLQTAGAGG
jgi:uncharacterized protein